MIKYDPGERRRDRSFSPSGSQEASHLPFRILTEEEAKVLEKQWDELKAALDAGMLE